MMTDREYIDPESEQIREVFARFGLAIFEAQALERQLAIIIATHHGPGSPTDYDRIIKSLFSKTLGQLVDEITSVAQLSEDIEGQLRRALCKRNWLAHNYFWVRAVEFVSESGRASMIEELQEIADSLHALDEVLTKRTREWGKTIGITQEMLDEIIERLVSGREDYLR